MPAKSLAKPRDPNVPDYAYISEPLVTAYLARSGKKKVANLFIGEWVKILDKPLPRSGRVHVRFRGGDGYIDRASMGRDRFLEIYFIDVDQGDSILINTPDDRRILIDGGAGAEAHTFIKNKYNLYDADNFVDFDAVVATHSDEDHTGGLIDILKDPKIAVKRFYHNGLFRRTEGKSDPGRRKAGRVFGLEDRPKTTDKPKLKSLMQKIVKAVDVAEANMPKVISEMKKRERWRGRIDKPKGGFVCKRLDAAVDYLPPFTARQPVKVEVLWPAAKKADGERSYPWYGDAGKTVNGNSVALLLRHGKQRILLAGDLNTESMDDMLLHYGRKKPRGLSRLRAHVYKAAHHGSQDFSVPFLKAVRPDAAVISSGDNAMDVHGHPRAVLMGTITRYSRNVKPAVFSTELAACFSKIKIDSKKQKALAGKPVQLYERALKGIVHLRSDGDSLYLGTVHGRRAPEIQLANILWKWDIWPAE